MLPVVALAQLGADVDATDEDGDTAEGWANENGHTSTDRRETPQTAKCATHA